MCTWLSNFLQRILEVTVFLHLAIFSPYIVSPIVASLAIVSSSVEDPLAVPPKPPMHMVLR